MSNLLREVQASGYTQLKKAVLRNWAQFGNTLVGDAFGHPKFKDGTPVRTSSIMALDLERGVCVTRNTIYTLESPVPTYEQVLPEADRVYIKETVDSEGFEDAFVNYTDFTLVASEGFHRRRKAYLASREELIKFCGLDSLL